MKSISVEQVEQLEPVSILGALDKFLDKFSFAFFLLKGFLWVGFSAWVVYIGLF